MTPETLKQNAEKIALTLLLLLTPSVAFASEDVGFEFTLHGYYIIDFIVFFGLLVYFGRKPIAAMLDQRHKTVAAEIEEAEEIRTKAEAKYQEYQSRLDRLEDELSSVMAEVQQGTQAEVERILADAKKAANRVAANEHTRLKQESKKIRDQLARHGAELALELAENRIRERLADPNTQNKLVERVLAELEQRELEVQT